MRLQEKSGKTNQKYAQLALAVSGNANSFGHDRFNPVFLDVPAIEKGGRPPVLTRLMGRLEQLYDDLARPRWKTQALQTNRTRRTHRVRRMYSQRREAVVRLLQAMVAHADLKTLTVVAWDKRSNKLEPASLRYLALVAGLGLKRADRAMADIEEMGLVWVRQRRTIDPEGQWKSMSALRKLSPLLFSLFGLGKELKASRRRKQRMQLDTGLGPEPSKTAQAFARLRNSKMAQTVKNALGSRAHPRRVEASRDETEAQRQKVRDLISSLDPDRRSRLE